ncbi:hypothetical protein [Streptomyces sp. ISL-12]|uniref:hypothetical protein n=1 Tax=Streptomyces sp. ISL-12 TaxID=2819177 RepID=UPI0020353809|nr:hypothetical protein [Streptomyces sp. ISL-12]
MVRRLGPDSRAELLQRDEPARVYRIDRELLEPLQRAFALTDARPDPLRGSTSETTT